MMMPTAGFGMATTLAGQKQESEEEEQPTAAVQTSFTLKLMSFAADKKIPLIKEIKSILPDTNLVQAKKLVEALPQLIKDDIGKEEAEKLKERLAAVGGESEIS